jgi:hypothetical protein
VPSFCDERLQLSRRVAAAIQEVYKLREAHQAAKPGSQEYTDLTVSLHEARKEQRAADRALNAHAEKHGCKASLSAP